MKINSRSVAGIALPVVLFGSGSFVALELTSISPSHAQEPKSAGSFVENFDRLDRSRWFISDGWVAGEHQNCTWSKRQVKRHGRRAQARLRQGQDRATGAYACGEVQTKQRYSYGTYEVRMKDGDGIGSRPGFLHLYRPDRQAAA